MKQIKRGSWGVKVAPYLFLLPTMAIFAVFIYWPAIYGIFISLTDSSGISKTVNFIGLQNYIRLFQDKAYWATLWATTRYVLLVVPITFAVSLGIALLLNNLRGKGLWRAIIYWPAMISPLIVGLIWKWIFGDSLGIVNFLLQKLGLAPIKWLSQPGTALLCIIIAAVWTGVGVIMVMFISGIKNIPEQYYEAAKIDGASAGQTFRRITFPLLKPTNVLVMITLIIAAFKVYPLVNALTKGGPGNSTMFIVQYIYTYAFTRNKLGYASAMSLILFVVLGLLTVVQFKLTDGGEIK